MAILEDLRAEITVEVNGVTAVEYDAPNITKETSESSGLVTCVDKYIESIDDATFSIRIMAEDRKGWLSAQSNHLYSFDVYVDGLQIRGYLMRPEDKPFKAHIDGADELDESSATTWRRKFKFGTVTTVEDADDEREREDMEKAKSLGSIEVRVIKCIKCISDRVVQKRYGRKLPESRDLNLASKATRGTSISHGMTFQAGGGKVTPPDTWEVSCPKDNHVATVLFRYGSKEALKQQLVIPRTPKPSPEPFVQPLLQPADYDSLSQEEKDRLGRIKFEELQGMRSFQVGEASVSRTHPANVMQQRDIKLENIPLVREASAGIKREHGDASAERPSKMPRSKGRREIVDLTND